jgi:hypothetical protein
MRISHSSVVLAFVLLSLSVISASAQQTLTLDTPITARYAGVAVSFEFNASENQTVLFAVNSQEANLAIEIYDPAGNFLISDDDSGDGINPAIGVRFTQAGQYRVNVLSYSGDLGEASFTIVAQPLDTAAEQEIALGGIVRGVLGDTFPTFNFTVDRETTLLIAPITFNFPALFTLRDASGQVIRTTENSVLALAVPVTPGRYQLALSSEFEGSLSGSYYAVLITETTIQPLSIGETVEVDAVGGRAFFFSFEGRAGDIIDIVMRWPEGDFTAGGLFTLQREVEPALFFSDSSPSSSFMSGVQLPADGTYRIEVFPYSTFFRAPFTLQLLQGSVLALSASPTTIVIGGDVPVKQLSAEVEAGRLYRFSVTTNNPMRPITAAITPSVTLSLAGAQAGSIEFVAEASGTLNISLRAESYFTGLEDPMQMGEEVTLVVTFEEVNR